MEHRATGHEHTRHTIDRLRHETKNVKLISILLSIPACILLPKGQAEEEEVVHCQTWNRQLHLPREGPVRRPPRMEPAISIYFPLWFHMHPVWDLRDRKMFVRPLEGLTIGHSRHLQAQIVDVTVLLEDDDDDEDCDMSEPVEI